MNGKQKNQQPGHRHPVIRSGSSCKGLAPGDTKIFRERGRAERVSGVEKAAGGKTGTVNNQGGRNAPALFLLISFFAALSVWRSASVPVRFGSGYSQIFQGKPIIRTHLLSEKGSDYMGLCCHYEITISGKRCNTTVPKNNARCLSVQYQNVCWSARNLFGI